MSDEENEIIGKDIFSLLSQIISKIDDLIILQGFFYAIILLIISLRYNRIDKTIIGSILLIYLLNTFIYIILKEHKNLDKEIEGISYNITYPQFFPNPSYLIEEEPTIRIIRFPLNFDIGNNTKEALNISVYIESKTQAIGFVLDEETTIWRRHYLIVPYKTISRLSLDRQIEISID
ncbi:MAG: hypothetical protein OEW87_15565, partial [Flavobacteriaceae bacterium]|nr:hypothetical protein [Flavobacteriaceae bacterium]